MKDVQEITILSYFHDSTGNVSLALSLPGRTENSVKVFSKFRPFEGVDLDDLKEKEKVLNDLMFDRMEYYDQYLIDNVKEFFVGYVAPEILGDKEQIDFEKKLQDFVQSNNLLEIKGDAVFMPEVSKEHSLPPTLIKRMMDLSSKGESYVHLVNFWRLCVLNPDAKARHNIFWYLDKYNFSISKSGFIQAFRGAVPKSSKWSYEEMYGLTPRQVSGDYIDCLTNEQDIDINLFNYYIDDANYGDCILKTEEEMENAVLFGEVEEEDYSTVVSLVDAWEALNDLKDDLKKEKGGVSFTDSHSGTTDIQIGKVVRMNREECDPNQDNTCSAGLHNASYEWLVSNNYYGKIYLSTLINPADIVAIPPQDGYGKLRTCAYLPIQMSEDLEGLVKYKQGFKDSGFSEVLIADYENNSKAMDYKAFKSYEATSQIERNIAKIREELKNR